MKNEEKFIIYGNGNDDLLLIYGNGIAGIKCCYADESTKDGFIRCLNLRKPCAPVQDKICTNIIEGVSEAIRTLNTELRYSDILYKEVRDIEDFNTRVRDALKAAEIDTVRDLVRLEPRVLLKYRNFGKKSYEIIEEWLKRNGLRFGMKV